MLAIPWYFARNNDSSTFTLAYGVVTFIVLFFGLYAGTLVDRFSRKANFLAINLICGTVLGVIAGLGYYWHSLPALAVIMVFGTTMLNYNIHYPTLYAFAHEITEPDQYQRVNSWIEIVGQATSILSGALAALLLEGVQRGTDGFAGLAFSLPFEINRWEIWEIFLLDAITYFMATLLIAAIRYRPVKELHIEVGSLWKRVRSGFTYLKQHPDLLVFGLFSYSVFAALLVCIHALLPIYIEHHLEEDGSVFAMADLIYAIGALSAGMFVGKVFQRMHAVKAIIVLTMLGAALFFWAFATKSVLVIYIFCVLLGFSNAGIRVLRLTWFFNHIPNEVMGRVNSIFNMANVLTRTLFIFLFALPFFTSGEGIVWAFFILSLFLLASGWVLVRNKSIRE